MNIEYQEEEINDENPLCYECNNELEYKMFESWVDSTQLIEHLTCTNDFDPCSLYMQIQD